jgi:hypothetical protein
MFKDKPNSSKQLFQTSSGPLDFCTSRIEDKNGMVGALVIKCFGDDIWISDGIGRSFGYP